MILRICAQATIILIHEEQNISSSIIFCNGYFGIKPYDSSCSGGNLMEKKKHTVVMLMMNCSLPDDNM